MKIKFNLNSKSFTLRISDKENMVIRKELLINTPVAAGIPGFHILPLILPLVIIKRGSLPILSKDKQ